jgi:hypothetical protein
MTPADQNQWARRPLEARLPTTQGRPAANKCPVDKHGRQDLSVIDHSSGIREESMTNLLPRELADRVGFLPRDASSGLLGLPASLAGRLSLPRSRDLGNRAQGLVEYRLLGALAIAGWSYRRALVDALLTGWPRPDGRPTATPFENGTFKRAFARLVAEGLWEECQIYLNGRPHILVRLTPLGRELLVEEGVACVESEWERMAAAHNGHGEGQLPHTAACCVFAYHARRLGYRTELVPKVSGPAEPDALIARAGEQPWYVEVQRRGGEPAKRCIKWLNLAELQGFAAICAERPGDARRFAKEAQAARIRLGYVTDLASLRQTELDETAELWAWRWRGASGLVRFAVTDEDAG